MSNPLLRQATGALADLGGPLAPVFWLLSVLTFLLVPLELFEVCFCAKIKHLVSF